MYTALKTAVLALVLTGFAVALAACAKYPALSGAPPAPSATAPALPIR
jgi:hypothetical protein